MRKLHIDIETYSSEDIKSTGAYKYVESLDFEIIMVAYAFDDEPVKVIDLASGEQLPGSFVSALLDPNILKKAHNANFERIAFRAYGYDVPADQWQCSAVKAAYCGLPLSLEDVSKAMRLEEKGKLSTGKALIPYFCTPCKPTKTNGMRTRNFPHHDPDKWGAFKQYCIRDVEAEREIEDRLSKYEFPESEKKTYVLDQKINDLGIKIDVILAENAIKFNTTNTDVLVKEVITLTGISNPNSPAQLKEWLEKAMGKEIKSLAKEFIDPLIKEAGAGTVSEVLSRRKKLSRSSIKKYYAMLNCLCQDGRAHGLFQFYGGNRTGRWAGRLIQLQNLIRNKINYLDLAREVVKNGDYEIACLLFDDISSILSQLIRTALIPKEGCRFAVSDFSSIEARVISWLAGEQWRLDVFAGHGKIYEESASRMFNIPIERITKDSEERAKGKIAELALGYQGGVGALKKMGGEDAGLTEAEMGLIVAKWRKASPSIVAMWSDYEKCALKAVVNKKPYRDAKNRVTFDCDGNVMRIWLPSGRALYYQSPKIVQGKYGPALKYMGMDQEKKIWTWVDTYGGKLTENIVQAIARDILVHSMHELDKLGFVVPLHVHDEVVAEVDAKVADMSLNVMAEVMGREVPWAKGLPLGADGYLTDFYKKD